MPAHSEVCPICGGGGMMPNPDPTCIGALMKCHGCGGCGWITVQDPPPYIPIVEDGKE